MKVWSITICKTRILKKLEDQVEDFKQLKLREFECPNCARLMLARQRYHCENGGGLYCFSCGKTYNKSIQDVYTEQK